jgi:ribonuclease HII
MKGRDDARTDRAGSGGREATGPLSARRRITWCDLCVERERTRSLFAEELSAWGSGAVAVAGVDEAGRGCLAGPVFAAAVAFYQGDSLLGLNDSKLLEPEVREELDGRIRKRAAAFGVGSASASEIDSEGIVKAASTAMGRALNELACKGTIPDLVLIDAFTIPGLPWPQRGIVKGDRKVACIAAASILAKTARDREMDRLDRTYPWYGFASHRGYGTPEHLSALANHGPSPLHRFGFDRVFPVRPAARKRTSRAEALPSRQGQHDLGFWGI